MFWCSSRNIRPAQSLERGWWVSLHTLQHINTFFFFYRWYVDKTTTLNNISVPIIQFVKMSSVKRVCRSLEFGHLSPRTAALTKVMLNIVCTWFYVCTKSHRFKCYCTEMQKYTDDCVFCTEVTTALVYSVTISVRSHISPRRSLWMLPSLLLWRRHHPVRSWMWPLQQFLRCHALVSFELSRK